MPLPYVADWRALGELRRSLAVLAALDAKVALYCHAPGFTTLDVVRDNIAYFDLLEARARAALGSGRVPEQLPDDAAIETLLEYPIERVPGYAGLGPQQQEYRATHRIAGLAMARWLRDA